jgi:hypothetical protein
MPPGRFHGNHEPRSRGRRLPHRLHPVPLDNQLDYLDLSITPRSSRLPARMPRSQCAQCHTNNNYTTVPTNCYGCHQADFNGTTNPSHVAAAFPTTCDTCHNTTDWTTVTFNHAVYANWALTGFHATLTCAQCHTNNNYTGICRPPATPATRRTLRAPRIPRTLPPVSPPIAPYATRPTNWTTSTFNHATTAFPLTGYHLTMQCVQCHTSANTYNLAAHPVLRLPRGGLERNHQSQPRRGGLPHHLRHLPHHHRLDRRNLQPQQHSLPADRRAHHRGLQSMPYQQRLCGHADRLLLLPPGGFHRNHQSEPRNCRLAHHLRHVPHHDRMAARDLACQLPHVLPHDSWQCELSLRHLPHQLRGLLRLPMHHLPWQ